MSVTASDGRSEVLPLLLISPLTTTKPKLQHRIPLVRRRRAWRVGNGGHGRSAMRSGQVDIGEWQVDIGEWQVVAKECQVSNGGHSRSTMKGVADLR
jgi:hypothetical protein